MNLQGLTRVKLLVTICLFLVISGVFIYRSDWFQETFLYPFLYRSTIYQYALENEVDPYLVAAVIRTESKFIPEARSPKGALGLMQMMPETAQWVAEQNKVVDFSPDTLTQPEMNIRLGTWYLASLKHEFENNEVLVLAAYNGGRGNVKEWMKKYGWTMEFSDFSQIPFKETREYVGKVLYHKQRYQDLYGR